MYIILLAIQVKSNGIQTLLKKTIRYLIFKSRILKCPAAYNMQSMCIVICTVSLKHLICMLLHPSSMDHR